MTGRPAAPSLAVPADIAGELGAAVGDDRVVRGRPLAPLTTFRVGGRAEWFVDVRGDAELAAVLAAAGRLGLAVTVLGGGSNVLVGDGGVAGLVVRARHRDVVRTGRDSVRASAGVTLNGLIRWLIRRGLGGLEAWAGTPGTVGGGVVGNAHFRGRLLDERVTSVGVIGAQGAEVVSAAAMGFGYDRSRVGETGEVVRWAEFHVHEADPLTLRATARASLVFRKRTQPLAEPSAGCVFRNPIEARGRLPDGLPCSAGALIDRAGLKGRACGGARVSDVHANFIVTGPGATARDVRSLIRWCQDAVAERFGVTLRAEVVLLGADGASR